MSEYLKPPRPVNSYCKLPENLDTPEALAKRLA